MNRTTRWTSAGLVLATGLVAAAAQAEGARRERTAPNAPAGVQVAIDPATGTTRQPTREEALELARQFRALKGSTKAAQVTQLASGAVMAELSEEHFDYTILTLDSSGRFVRTCVDGAHLAAALAAPAVAPAAPVAEEK